MDREPQPRPCLRRLGPRPLRKNVIASFAYTGDDFRRAAELAASLSLDWVEIVALEHSDGVFMDLYRGETDIVKAVVQTGAE